MTRSVDSSPDISVVVTVVDGGITLERCLEALAEQSAKVSMEVLVPYDHISTEVKELGERFPDFDFIDLGRILDGHIPVNAFEKHRFYDTRRSEALKLARADLVAILEDRGVPAPDWAESMVTLHEQHAHAAIGGAIENGVDKALNWAAYISDFGRYQPPFSTQEPEYISDTNICYKRDALLGIRPLWEKKYDEARVNWALRRDGKGLMLSERPRTVQLREPMGILDMMKERIHWGRNFGRSRSREIRPIMRVVLGLATPVLPFLLYIRHLRRQLSKRRNTGAFILASPALLVLLVCWSVGECIGYYEGASSP